VGRFKADEKMTRLLAFVDIFVDSPSMDDVVAALRKLDTLEELYEVTGEYDIVTLVSAADIEEFRDVLKNKIMKIKGVKSTVSSIVLKTHKGPRCNGDDNGEPHRSRVAAQHQ
jgi:DNA-binding Lrp family transcriptional regulator